MPVNALRQFIRWESSAGILLFAAAILALIISNSPWATAMADVLGARAAVIVGPLAIDKTVLLWINDGLMAMFFLLVGLELKREVLEGQLSSWGQLALPLLGAAGGFILPAVIFAAMNAGDADALRGWAIPSATDIAFALGVLSLFGKRVPLSLKIFLTTLAIIDDLAAIVVIAIFYTSELSLQALLIAGAGLVTLAALNLFNVSRIAIYMVVGVVVWVAVLKSGVHATLAGVMVAFAIPLSVPRQPGHSPLRHLEHALHPWIVFAILPLFALANAGIPLGDISMDVLASPLTFGIMAGLVIGKQLGVFVPVWLAIRMGWINMPAGANYFMLYGVAVTTGIGFTMSFFIGTLAYANLNETYSVAMKVGVLCGSLISMVLGIVLLIIGTRTAPAENPSESASEPSATR